MRLPIEIGISGLKMQAENEHLSPNVHVVHTYPLQNRSFHVVERLTRLALDSIG